MVGTTHIAPVVELIGRGGDLRACVEALRELRTSHLGEAEWDAVAAAVTALLERLAAGEPLPAGAARLLAGGMPEPLRRSVLVDWVQRSGGHALPRGYLAFARAVTGCDDPWSGPGTDVIVLPDVRIGGSREGFARAKPPEPRPVARMAGGGERVRRVMRSAPPPVDERTLGMTAARPPSPEPGPTAARAVHAKPPEPKPEKSEPRQLHVDVAEEATGLRRQHAFAPGKRHTVSVHIGPEDGRGLAVAFAESRVEATPSGAILDVELVTGTPEGTTHERRQLLLPQTGPSAAVEFPLDVAAGAKDVLFSVLVYQGARVIQSVEVEGPVAKRDTAVRGRELTIRSVSEAEPDPMPVPKSADVDLSLSFQVGASDEVLANSTKDGARVVALGDLGELTGQVVDVLRGALGADAVDGTKPGSEQQRTLLRQLAQLGNTMFQQLEEQLGEITVQHGVQITTWDDQVVPIEVVYDRGFPADAAKLCKNWQRALKTGKCTCRKRNGEVRTICPLGFWGVRLTVERQLAHKGGRAAAAAGQRRPGAEVLPALDRVLFAASAKVDQVNPDERAQTTKRLADYLGDRCVTAASWAEWRRAVRDHRPGLLLALPHNEENDTHLPVLQIGKSSGLNVGGMTTKEVLAKAPDAAGPVVMLLGCNTAVAEVPWQSAVDAFRRNGAAVVVGTLAETLGRQTGPMARLLADSLWGPDAVREQTMGEVMRSVRRQLLLQGATLGMSLVAFGHAGWLLPQKDGGT